MHKTLTLEANAAMGSAGQAGQPGATAGVPAGAVQVQGAMPAGVGGVAVPGAVTSQAGGLAMGTAGLSPAAMGHVSAAAVQVPQSSPVASLGGASVTATSPTPAASLAPAMASIAPTQLQPAHAQLPAQLPAGLSLTPHLMKPMPLLGLSMNMGIMDPTAAAVAAAATRKYQQAATAAALTTKLKAGGNNLVAASSLKTDQRAATKFAPY